MKPTVGIIANPASARDIRRIVADASSLQTADRANIVLRVLRALAATGIQQVLMMPDPVGIRTYVERGVARASTAGNASYPAINFLDITVAGTVEDTLAAARKMREHKVSCIVVLGGDGTHRAVASVCGNIPIAGISTGTNNAFPIFREPTVVGIAAGLSAMHRIPVEIAAKPNKALVVTVGGREEIAVVDVAVVTDRYAGAKALWRPDSFRELYVAFAQPASIGMSAIAALVDPVTREDPRGVGLMLAPAQQAGKQVLAPIAPGVLEYVGIQRSFPLMPDQPARIELSSGAIALDGEREMVFSEHDRVEVTLVRDYFYTLDIESVMMSAAKNGLMTVYKEASSL